MGDRAGSNPVGGKKDGFTGFLSNGGACFFTISANFRAMSKISSKILLAAKKAKFFVKAVGNGAFGCHIQVDVNIHGGANVAMP